MVAGASSISAASAFSYIYTDDAFPAVITSPHIKTICSAALAKLALRRTSAVAWSQLQHNQA
ncbi:hypothetical protein MACH18_36570 [Phaeobacter italicus]|nr:hypothetical protein MACH18_36570 [Phaeobacter italicus]